jgi:RNA polymerase sigma-70 factor (sigma-E family)
MADRAGFQQFVTARSRHLLRVAYLLVGDLGLAQDLLQEALVRSWFAWHRIAGADPEAYVRRVMVNTYISGLRRRSSGEIVTAAPPERAQADDAENVEHRIILTDALRRLPRKQRALIVLRYFEDLTEAQTAEVLGCSVGTVKSQTSRALSRLRVDPTLSGGRAGDPPAAALRLAGGTR